MTGRVSAVRLRALLDVDAVDRPGYRDIAERVRLLVIDGRLPSGTQLPSERDLTTALPVSRTTVTRAYAELREAGLLVSRRGSGSVVTLAHDAGASGMLAPAEAGPGAIGWTVAASAAAPGVGLAYAQAAATLPAYLHQSGYVMTGVPALREALAARYTERGLPTDATQIMVTGGAVAALGLIARTLAVRGERVLCESPTYPNAIESVRRSGLRPVAVPLDEDCWHLPSFEATLRQAAPRLAYLIPDFHNPTGALMDAATRDAFGAALTRARTTPVIDETMVELVLDGDDDAMPPPFAASAPDAITIGSASKSFWGGIRIGWVRASHDMVRLLVDTRHSADLGSPVFEQLVLVELLARRAEVLAEHRAALRRQRDELATLVTDRLPGWQFTVPPGGLSLWAQLPARVSSTLVIAAAREGLILTAGPRFFVGAGGERHLRLPFAREHDDLAEAVTRLARAYERCRDRTDPPSTAAMHALTA